MTVAVETVSFKKFPAANGLLCVCESGRSVPFDIRRVFLVSAGSGDIRGDHAHKAANATTGHPQLEEAEHESSP